jgi:RNA-splicing ligase RtcB
MEIKGRYCTAEVMINDIDEATNAQLLNLSNQKMFENSSVKIMPDCHAGKGCVVGFTATVKDKIVPNLVGVDISCSISSYKLNVREIDLRELDDIIKRKIPSGMNVRGEASNLIGNFSDEMQSVLEEIGDIESYKRHLLSIGTLGGGNHFIELNRGDDGYLWLTIHSGSRNFGHKICTFHQDKAIKNLENKKGEIYGKLDKIKALENAIERKKLHEDISKELKDFKFDKELAYLEGSDTLHYIRHMNAAKKFAQLNHKVMKMEILDALPKLDIADEIFTNHNYIEYDEPTKTMMIRKGAVSAKKDERLIIPMNMRDGSFICAGKGNSAWNYSAPHGAGRILSRMQARNSLDMEKYKKEMQSVYSTCVTQNTIDESPMAYKDMNAISKAMRDSVEILERIVPVYNFKAS